MNTIIEFSSLDRIICGTVGVQRNNSAFVDKRYFECGRRELGFEFHIRGAMGELAASRMFGLHWQPLMHALDTKRGDVGGYQIKTIVHKKDNLLVRQTDPEDFNYLLFLVSMQQAAFLGWMPGVKAKTYALSDKTLTPCHLVPTEDLYPPATLP